MYYLNIPTYKWFLHTVQAKRSEDSRALIPNEGFFSFSPILATTAFGATSRKRLLAIDALNGEQPFSFIAELEDEIEKSTPGPVRAGP